MKKIMAVCFFTVLLMVSGHVFAETITDEDWKNLREEWEERQAETETEIDQDSSELEDNTLAAVIEGEEYTFYLVSAEMKESYLTVDSPMALIAVYRTYNPRGDALYQIELYLDSNIAPGEYNNNEELDNCKAAVSFKENMNIKRNIWENEYVSYIYADEGAYCDLTIDSRSDDWTAYAGTFQARCVDYTLGGYRNVDVDGAFQFTLNEAYLFPEEESGQESEQEIVSDEQETEPSKQETEPDMEKRDSSSEVCLYCNGSGDCSECIGLGECSLCFGEGEISCETCGGTGTCPRCFGLGGEEHYSFSTGENEWIACSYCDEEGTCPKCGGSRYEECSACHETGLCRKCSGTGVCSYCGGTGKSA